MAADFLGLPAHLCLVRVDGDGSCLFHAVALHVPLSASELRSMSVSFMRDATWADSLVVQALASALDRAIVVYSPRSPPLLFSPFNRDVLGLPIAVAYNGVNHFDGLIAGASPCVSVSLVDPVPIPVECLVSARPRRNRSLGFQHLSSLRVGCLNCTSLGKHFAEIAGWPFDVILLQETRVNAGAQNRLSRDLLDLGWSVLWGAPTMGQAQRADGTVHSTTAQGGVAILVRSHFFSSRSPS